MADEYETKTRRLTYFLSGDDQTTLQIPHYQRGYSWRSDQVSDFFSDLYEHMDEPDLYYFGTITTISLEPKKEVERYELIDGQQRFTTAIILMACIRDKFHELGSHYEKETEEQIFNKSAKGHDVYYKLILDKDDDLFFHDNILDKLSEQGVDKLKNVSIEYETQTNLKNAYDTIRKSIDSELDKNWKGKEIEFLNKLRTTLRRKFVISNLEVSKPSKAYALFNRMNDRGLKLAPSDLAKDLILSLIDDEISKEAAEQAAKKWRELENKLSKKKIMINNYIHHYLVTFHPTDIVSGEEKFRYIQKTKDFDILERILKMKKVIDNESKRITGNDFLNNLFAKSSNYETLISYRLPNSSKIYRKTFHHPKISSAAEDNIKWINELGIIIVYPVLMAGLEKYEKGDFEKLTDIVLKWFFRVKTVANRNASALEKELAYITYRMMKGDSQLNRNLNIDDVRNELIDLDISPNVFDSYLMELSLGNKQSKYFLTKIITYQQGKDRTDLSYPFTLEHIMPYKGIRKLPTKANEDQVTWLEYIKKVNKMSEEDAISFHQNYKNRLGNLTLISKTKTANIGIASFDQKCKIYQESHIQLTHDITKYEQWNKGAIEKRQKDLAEIAKEVWKI